MVLFSAVGRETSALIISIILFIVLTFSAKSQIDNTSYVNSRISNNIPFLGWSFLIGIIIMIGYTIHTKRNMNNNYIKRSGSNDYKIAEKNETCPDDDEDCDMLDAEIEQSHTRIVYLIKSILLYSFALAYVVNKYKPLSFSGGSLVEDIYQNLFQGRNFVYMIVLILIMINTIINLYVYAKNQDKLNKLNESHYSLLRGDFISNLVSIFGMIVTFIFIVTTIKPNELNTNTGIEIYTLDSKYGAVFRGLLFATVMGIGIYIINANKCTDDKKCGGFMGIPDAKQEHR